MRRYFPFYVKKRGGRRTDSPMIGSLALTLFFALLMLVGVGFFAVLMLRLIVPEWRAQHRFIATSAVVLKTRPRPTSVDETKVFRPDILIQYEVDGTQYQTWTYDVARVVTGSREEVQSILDRFETGREYPCWYDPDYPDTAVLVRRYSWTAWLMTVLPVALVVVGGAGLAITLLNWGKSAERRAALAQRRLNLEIFEPIAATNRRFPTLPSDNHLTNSPGTMLKFRLPLDVAPQWTTFVLGSVAVGVLAIAAFFGLFAVQGNDDARPDWFMIAFAGLWAIAGLVLLGFVIRNLIRNAAVGATIIEVSDHPWRSGEHYELVLNQTGRLSLSRLELRLVCEEKATFSQGTNTRSEVATVYQEVLVQREALDVARTEPFEVRCEFTLPPRAMHSFVTDHNEIGWRLVLEGKAPRHPGFVRSFPVVVFPPRAVGETP